MLETKGESISPSRSGPCTERPVPSRARRLPARPWPGLARQLVTKPAHWRGAHLRCSTHTNGKRGAGSRGHWLANGAGFCSRNGGGEDGGGLGTLRVVAARAAAWGDWAGLRAAAPPAAPGFLSRAAAGRGRTDVRVPEAGALAVEALSG